MMEELIAALEKCEGPDRWCDANIYVMAHGQTIEIFGGNIVSNGHCVIGWLDPGKVNVNFATSGIGERIPRYTESIDAALALLDHVLPGWFWRVGHGSVEDWAHLNRIHPDHCLERDEAHGKGGSPAIALCVATLKAKLSQDRGDH